MTQIFDTPGLNQDLVRALSAQKAEPAWMLAERLRGLELFLAKPLPTWGADLQQLAPHDLYYYIQPLTTPQPTWEALPDHIKTTFKALGIPQAEQKLLAGVGAQFDSEVIYKSLKAQWRDLGVIFCDLQTGLREHPALFQKYFGTVIPAHDNKFAALNTAVWSGGSFVYVPPGVQVAQPLQAYFRIDRASMGQFERTLIIADEGASVHYVEGCSAPIYSTQALHSAVVEIIALPGAHVRYTTIQNWSKNVYNLVTKRAVAYADSVVEWIDGNFGSQVTMKYPAIILKGARARGQIISLAVAGAGQHLDAGAKVIHLAPQTTSNIVSKSISQNGGRASYRGLLKVAPTAQRAVSRVRCDALILDQHSRSDTYPTVDVKATPVDVGHEASISQISDTQLAYLMSRGLTAAEACAMIVNGFIDCFVQELPMEYAVEINRLIAFEMTGSIG